MAKTIDRKKNLNPEKTLNKEVETATSPRNKRQ
jgi:hypothetical protein